MAPHQSPSLILLCTPSYDAVTCFFSRLLSGFSYPDKVVHHVRLERDDKSYQDVVAQYRANQEKVVLIFCGHGEEDALLTGLKQDCARLTEPVEGVFYDSNSVGSGPDVLAAFCSSAGNGLGIDFTRATRGDFLGFCEELWLNGAASQECNSWWMRILNGFVSKVIADEKVDVQTVNFVRSLYMEAMDYFSMEERRSGRDAIAMRMCLRKHLWALCRH